MVLGIVIALAPFVGLPSSWVSSIYVVCGFGVFFVGFFMRRPRTQPPTHEGV
jgi:hypothetical protein